MNQNEKSKLEVGTIVKDSPVNMSYDGYGDEDDELGAASSYNKKPDSKSKTPVLDNFSKDLTRQAAEGKIDPVVGREKEIDLATLILARRRKNNPIILGEAGVGKTAIVEGIALKIISKNCARTLFDKRIVSLDISSVISGTKYRGQFEERLKAIMNELEKNPDVILFIDEIHNIIGAGGASGSLDTSNMLKPALSRGHIQIIGATTLDEYRQHVEKDTALARRFQRVDIDAPTDEETIVILSNIKEPYEKHHKVEYTPEAIEACVRLSTRYIADRKHPDKAIDILDVVGGKVHIANMRVPQHILDLEAELVDLKNQKEEVVQQQKYEEAGKLRDVEKNKKESLKQAKANWELEEKNLRFPVTEDHVAEVVSFMTGIPVTKVGENENKKLSQMLPDLTGKVIGQDDAVKRVVKAIQRNRVGLGDPNRPASFMLIGKSGVGKTLLAKELAKNLFGTESALIRVDMSEYSKDIDVSKFIGASAGYVGYEQGSKFLNDVRNKPYSVILLDEIEKAHSSIYNLLLQLLDDGQMTDNTGRVVSFKNCIILMTSNVGVKAVMDFGTGAGFETKQKVEQREDEIKDKLKKELQKHFAPEFINRLDEIVYFRDLNRENITQIIDIGLSKMKPALDEKGITITLDESLKEALITTGYDANMGARPLNRAIQRLIQDPLTEKIIDENIVDPVSFRLSYDPKTEVVTVDIVTTKELKPAKAIKIKKESPKKKKD